MPNVLKMIRLAFSFLKLMQVYVFFAKIDERVQ